MYAIVQCGGHQVKMIPGETLVVDRIDGDKGAEISFDQVLMVEKDGGELMAGAPFLAGARVVAVVDGVARGPRDPGVQEEAAQGDAADQGASQHLHARHGQGHRALG